MDARLFIGGLVATLAIGTTPAAAIAGDGCRAHRSETASDEADIVDTAVAAGSFDTLVAAVKAAGLVDALKGDGPFTVFAPTDAAFAKLPKGTIASLLKPENKDQLTAILTYHVIPGKVMASQVSDGLSAASLQGQKLDFTVGHGGAAIENARIVKTDIACTNGVIHVIDTVILPASESIVGTAKNAGTFETLLAAAGAAGLADVLDGQGPFTVFAPTDEAFAKLPAGTVESLLKPENKDLLVAILKFHVVSGRVYAKDALGAGAAETLQGESITIAARDGGAYVQESKIVATDIEASNGVIHVIDSVLLPKDGASHDQRRAY